MSKVRWKTSGLLTKLESYFQPFLTRKSPFENCTVAVGLQSTKNVDNKDWKLQPIDAKITIPVPVIYHLFRQIKMLKPSGIPGIPFAVCLGIFFMQRKANLWGRVWITVPRATTCQHRMIRLPPVMEANWTGFKNQPGYPFNPRMWRAVSGSMRYRLKMNAGPLYTPL